MRYSREREDTLNAGRKAVVDAVCEAAGLARDEVATWGGGAGSALNATASLAIAGRSFFVKTNDATRASMLESEADGLAAIARTGAIRVPAPIVHGVAGNMAFLVLEWLDIDRGGRDAALGRALAAMHRTIGPRFGWHRDNTIGTTRQTNAWSDSWVAFFGERRLAAQLDVAARNGYRTLARAGEGLLEALPALLAGHDPQPSLVHGDLWSGNAARLATGEPVVFDPAVHYGDREVDLAMSRLFGGFGADFYAAYAEMWPLSAGQDTRATLYNVYHVVNHANLFGGGYAAQAESMIGRLTALAR